MKYKVTRRGWIVFSTLALLLILLIYNVGSSIFDNNSDENITNDVDTSNISQADNQEVNNQEDENDSTEASEVTETEVTEEETSNQTDVTENEAAEEESEDTTSANADYSQYIDTTVEVYFDKNVAKLQDEFKLKLDDLIVILKEFEALSVTVEGHINGYPYYDDGDFGLKISNDRAVVVANYLYKNGISEDRIVIVNMGSRDQVDKSDQIEMHYLNRRAVLKLHE